MNGEKVISFKERYSAFKCRVAGLAGFALAAEWAERDPGTALAVIPRNELAIVAQKEEAKADKLRKALTRIAIGGITGAGMLCFGFAALHLAPIIAPIVAITGAVSYFGGGVAGNVIESKEGKARDRAKAAVRVRRSNLIETAQTALEGAVADGTIRAGLDLRITPQDETPKKVHVHNMGAITDADGKKRLSISGQVLEEDGKIPDWMQGDAGVSLQQTVAVFPKAALDSIRPEPTAIAPEPPAAREPEKILPKITL